MGWECELDSSVSGYGLVADPCEHGNEPPGSIKEVGIFLTSWATISSSRTVLNGVSYNSLVSNVNESTVRTNVLHFDYSVFSDFFQECIKMCKSFATKWLPARKFWFKCWRKCKYIVLGHVYHADTCSNGAASILLCRYEWKTCVPVGTLLEAGD